MKNLPLSLMVLTLTVVSGCASLSVQVDILDPGYVRSALGDAKLLVVYSEIEKNGVGGASEPIRRFRLKWLDAGKKLAVAYKQYTAGKSESEKGFLIDAARDFDRLDKMQSVASLDATISTLDESATLAIKAALKTNWNRQLPIPASVQSPLSTILNTLFEFAKIQKPILQTEIDEMKSNAQVVAKSNDALPSVKATAADAAKTAVSAELVLKTITGAPSLASSEYAYFVSKADDQFWSHKFNRAFAQGTFGSTDIVIKLNSQADFTVKGMRFDATTVAAVASKVMTQAILLGSQMAGVPIPTSTATGFTGDGKQLADASGQLAANDDALALRAAKIAAWKQAIRDMANAILGEDGTLTSISSTSSKWSAEKAAVVGPIEGTKDALKPILSLTGL